MIKNIIFDLAGVIMNLNIERDTAALNAAGFPDFAGCLADASLRTPMLAYLNGLMPKQEFFDRVRPLCKPGVKDEEINWAMNAVLDDIPASRLRMLVELRKQYRIFLLSNIYDEAWAHAVREVESKGYKLDECFDRLFLSHEMQLAKPDAAIFNAVCQQAGITPDETLFFDDSRENIEAACQLQFHAYLVPMNHVEEIINSLLHTRF